jgi:hypothetical protein
MDFPTWLMRERVAVDGMPAQASNLTIIADVSFIWNGMVLQGRRFVVTTPVSGSGLTNAQAADAALKAEIATYIQDVATKLQQALAGGDPDSDVQAIADDLNADATTLQQNDPLTGTNATGTTGTSTTAGTSGTAGSGTSTPAS